MSDSSLLRLILKRGALITAANWPVVLVQFVAESTFKLLIGVAVVGGAILVAIALGRDLTELLRGEFREVVASVGGSLIVRPGAFIGFLTALFIVLVGGSAGMFLIKGGSVSVLAASESAAGPIERLPVTVDALRRAGHFSIDTFITRSSRLFPRYLRLGMMLFGVYLVSGGVYIAVVGGGYALAAGPAAAMGWTVIVAVCSTGLILWITIVNTVYLLSQMVVAVEDCSVGRAFALLAGFLRTEFRAVGFIFVVVLGLVVIATGASIAATAGLGLISFVPLLGLAVLPLQAAAWLVRGLVFQYLGLAALGAYLVLYRRSRTDNATRDGPTLVRTAS